MFTSCDVMDLLNTMLSKVETSSREAGRIEQVLVSENTKSYSKDKEIADLKAKLAKHEAVPGFPIPFTPISHHLTSDEKCRLFKEAVAHHANGNKIGAIKVIREMTGAGLKEAKDCYEAAFAVEVPITGNPNTASMENLLRLVKNEPESKIAIIKEVRSLLGIGLKEAKDAVEYALTGSWDSNYLGGGRYKPINSRW